ncbi:DUF1778 domain-containing protein [Telmatospirillum sp.]|uniref:type II toxin-antitoxin system TacA family antitoxin n=1 Tax=Telmatospirillum sp. TaxID=2079197 RepID=UPI0028496D56|nr:DUF1778 domain-containing protein [Telmatospirillum sp.]MDR3440933.1 DUF1778 domain-containing protein [Telmatospirillum sp.]
MAQTSGNESRIAMRVDPDQKALIERGAQARGLSVTDFMLTLALREAEIALTERTFFVLDDETYDHFLVILDRPAQEKPELGRLVEKNKRSKWKIRR